MPPEFGQAIPARMQSRFHHQSVKVFSNQPFRFFAFYEKIEEKQGKFFSHPSCGNANLQIWHGKLL